MIEEKDGNGTQKDSAPLRELGLAHDPATGKPGGLLLQEDIQKEQEIVYAVTLIKMSDGNISPRPETEINGKTFHYNRQECLALLSVSKEKICAIIAAETVIKLLELSSGSKD